VTIRFRLVTPVFAAALVLASASCTSDSAPPPTTPSASATPQSATDALPTPAPTAASIVDRGEREGAAGVVRETPGGTLEYVAVAGDATSAVCDRFDRRWWQISRPATAGPFDCNTEVVVGDVLVPTDEPQNGRPD